MSELEQLADMIYKDRNPDMSGKNRIDHRKASRLLREIHCNISALRAENERLKDILTMFSEYLELGDQEYYQIPKVKIEIAKKALEGK